MVSQSEKLFGILSDGLPHRVDELVTKVYEFDQGPSIARLGARVWDLKKKYGFEIKSWPDPNNRKLWFYQILAKNLQSEGLKPDRCLVQPSGVWTQGSLFESNPYTDY